MGKEFEERLDRVAVCVGCGATFQKRHGLQKRCRKGCGRQQHNHHVPCPDCDKRMASRSRLCAACAHPRQIADCPQCAKPFWPWLNGSNARKFCSRKCAGKAAGDRMRGQPGQPGLRPRRSPEERKRRIRARRAQENAKKRKQYANDGNYRDQMKDRSRNTYQRNHVRIIERVRQWKRSHGQSVRLDSLPCPGCGRMLPPRRLIYCSDRCARREGKRSGCPDFRGLTKAVHEGRVAEGEVAAFSDAWRALRSVRRAINGAYKKEKWNEKRNREEG